MAERVRAAAFARQEDLEALARDVGEHLEGIYQQLARLDEFERQLTTLATSLLDSMHSIIELQEAVFEPEVAPGRADWMEEAEEVEADLRAVDDARGRPETDPERQARIDALVNDDGYDPDFSSPEDGPEDSPETEADRQRRIEEVRARRRAAVQQQIVKAFEEGNESDPALADPDPNAITDVPEEGITLDPGRDPWTGEAIASWEGEGGR